MLYVVTIFILIGIHLYTHIQSPFLCGLVSKTVSMHSMRDPLCNLSITAFCSLEKKLILVSRLVLNYLSFHTLLAAVTLCLGNAPASPAGLGSTAMRHVPRDSMASHVSRSAAAKMVLTAIV